MALRLLLSTMLLPLATADAPASSLASSAAWPHSVQPFFLSAISSNLTSEDVSYLAQLPVVVINHKEGGTGSPEEERQLYALSQVRAANASCATFFYLNSEIDFTPLQLHQEFVKNGTWWLRDDKGNFVLHNSDHIFDVRVAAARRAWLATAQHALAQPYISGVFVDKAGGFWNEEWSNAHTVMLDALIEAATAAKKQLIFNDVGVTGKAGQLFERWGAVSDHDKLNVTRNMDLLKTLTGAGSSGQIFSIVRAGGPLRGGVDRNASAEVCGAGLAAMLLAVASPNAAFFACEVSFDVKVGWMHLDNLPIYRLFLGAPLGEAVVGPGGLVTRTFEGANVTLNTSAFNMPGRAGLLNRGCVRWAKGETTGTCP